MNYFDKSLVSASQSIRSKVLDDSHLSMVRKIYFKAYRSTLVMSSPAWPNIHKSGQDFVFRQPFQVCFAKHIYYEQSSHWRIILIIGLNLSGPWNMR